MLTSKVSERFENVQVQNAWREAAAARGSSFGFNLKMLPIGGRFQSADRLRYWQAEARTLGIQNRDSLSVAVFVPPLYGHVLDLRFQGHRGVQEIHWETAGSYTGGTSAASIRNDFLNLDSVLVNHSEVIRDHGRTLDQAAAQVRTALDSGFTYITICVGEDRSTYMNGVDPSLGFVRTQVRTILGNARVTMEEMRRLVFAYEPRYAIQEGDTPGIPPKDSHLAVIGWGILGAAADVAGLEGMRDLIGLQYGGSMKGPGDGTAPVQRFVGPDNMVERDLYSGGLIGTAGADPKTAAEIVNRIVPIR